MAMIEIDWNPPRRQLRQFAVMFLVFAAGLGTIFYFKGKPLIVSEVLWNLSWVVGIAGLVFPPLVRPVYVVMMAVALPIGLVVSTALMVLIFYGILTPLGVTMRWAGYDPMGVRRKDGRESFWIERPRDAEVRRYFRQY